MTRAHCPHFALTEDFARAYLQRVSGVDGEQDQNAVGLGDYLTVDSVNGMLYCRQCKKFIWTYLIECLYRNRHTQMDLAVFLKFHLPHRLTGEESEDDQSELKRHCVGMRGLHNLGKTCFMNAVLQVLLHNPHLFKFFLTMGHDPRSCPITGESMSDASMSASASSGSLGQKKKPTQQQQQQQQQKMSCVACEIDRLYVEVRFTYISLL